jgi:hypothetical protein
MRKSKSNEEGITKSFDIQHLVDETMDDINEGEMSLKEVITHLALSAKSEGFFETKYPNKTAESISFNMNDESVTWEEIVEHDFMDDDEDSITEVMENIEKYTSQDLIELQLQIAIELSSRMG